jgi:hypothetical protein
MSVSVVIPCYNRAHLIGRSIQSALGQTVVPDEIIVVDDGSTDGSAAVARTFGSRMRVIEQENAGAAAARNRGIAAASGEWIAFLDSDDEWHPEKLQRQLAAAARFPRARLVFCDTEVRNQSGVTLPSRFALGGLIDSERETDGEVSCYDRRLFGRMLTQSRVITSAVLVRNGLPELKFPEHIWGSEDWALWLRLALAYPFASVNALLVTMHQQGDNISARKSRLSRNDVAVLRELAEAADLTVEERSAVLAELTRRRVGAVYLSLVSGETREARKLFPQVSRGDLGWRYGLYYAAAHLPGALLRWMRRQRFALSGDFENKDHV